MECPARQSIVQLIPFVNNSQIDYNINFNLKTESKVFNGTGDTSIKKNSTLNYELKFTPQWIGT